MIMEYLDGFNYANIEAPEAHNKQESKYTAEEILSKYDFNPELHSELLEDLDYFINNEVKNITLEFISRFFQRLGKGSKTAYATCRALGFHVFLTDKNGNEIHSLKEIADYWNVCPQLIDQLSKQIQKDLDFEPINNLSIHKKNYSYKVKAPDGFMTTGEVIEFLNISNKKLNSIIKTLGIKKKDHSRGSKIIRESDVDRVELWLMGEDES